MPIYEYKCSKCRAQFEVVRKVSDPPPKKCKKCGGPLKKVLTAPAIQFKGSGWYVTDYPKKSSPDKEGPFKRSAKKTGSDAAPSPASPAGPSSDDSSSLKK